MPRLKKFVSRIIASVVLMTIPMTVFGVGPDGPPRIDNPLTGDQTAAGGGPGLFPRFALLLMQYLGVIFMAAIIYGGFLWIVSGGNSERVDQGQKILTWSTIGMIVVAFAYVIVKLVLSAIIAGGEPISQ